MADLAGRRVDIGLPGSGRNASLTRLFETIEFTEADRAAFVELPAVTAFEELCAGRLDASVAIVGHPNAGIAQALASCDIELVPVGASPRVAQALEATRGLNRATIPADAYPELDRDIPTFAVIATIVTGADTDPRIVESLVAAVLEDLPQLAVRAPVLASVSRAAMRTEGLTAPLHPGAEAAFDAFGD
jgi:TRAP transporter TAXI family solute receptor